MEFLRRLSKKERESNKKNILVPYNDSQESRYALSRAVEYAKIHNANLIVAYVVAVPHNKPLDAELTEEANLGEKILDNAEENVNNMDFEIPDKNFQIIQARDISLAIIDLVVDENVSEIFLGDRLKNDLGEFEIGKVTTGILRHATCKVNLLYSPESS